MFKGVERDPNKVRSLVTFHVSLSALVSKAFCIYSLGTILPCYYQNHQIGQLFGAQ